MASYIGEPKRRILRVREIGEGDAFRVITTREGRLVIEDGVNFFYLRDANSTVWARIGSESGYITHFDPDDCCVRATVKEQLDANGVILIRLEEIPAGSEVIAYRYISPEVLEQEDRYKVISSHNERGGTVLRSMTGYPAYTVFHDTELVRFQIVVPVVPILIGPQPGRRFIDI